MLNSTEVQANRAITVPFHGVELYVVEHNGQPYTPMKAIVEGMGLAWQPQHRKLSANDARWGVTIMVMPIRKGITMTEMPSGGGAQSEARTGGAQQAMLMPLRKLPGWLATIDPGRVKSPEVRERVIQYQNECDDVLWQYWNDGIAVNPRALYSVNPGDTLTKEEADSLLQLIESTAKRLSSDTMVQGQFIRMAWTKLKSHFKVTYREIPRHELTEALSIVSRHTTEWEVVDDFPVVALSQNAELLKGALALATEVATEAARTVFNALIDGNADAMQDRWMFSMTRGRDGKPTEPWAKAIAQDEMVVSMNELPRRILEPNGMLSSDAELANLASACTQRLAQSAAYRAKRALAH